MLLIPRVEGGSIEIIKKGWTCQNVSNTCKGDAVSRKSTRSGIRDTTIKSFNIYIFKHDTCEAKKNITSTKIFGYEEPK